VLSTDELAGVEADVGTEGLLAVMAAEATLVQLKVALLAIQAKDPIYERH
jgi:hypothetical protein